MSLDPTVVAKIALHITKEIYDRLQGCSENDAVCQRIKAEITKLQGIATDLQKLEVGGLPETCRSAIDEFSDSLELCRRVCNDINRTGNVVKFLKVRGHKSDLETLDTQLKRATESLQLVLGQVSILQNRRIEEAVHRGTEDLRGTIINPRQGVFLPNSKVAESRPHKIDHPEVTLDESGDLMEVKWKDEENQRDTVDYYEVRYDDENDHMVSAKVDECVCPSEENTFYMKLGQPKIKIGSIYSVQVRGINGAGPGDWSETTIFKFKTGPPNKPKKPTVEVQTPTEVLIIASKLPKKDENGSCVTRCKVEYVMSDGDDTTWKILESNIKQRSSPDVKLKIGSLVPDTTYNFRIKMINDIGESPPSDSQEVLTTQLIPDRVQNLRISSKRKDKSLKLRWEEPAINPQAAHKYKVQMRLKKEHKWEDYITVDKKSVKIVQLSTDTKYAFRVRSINSQGDCGEWSNEIEAETRFGIFGRTLGTIGAVVGGTVGGPLIGAVGGGAMAGIAAGKIPDSQAGQRAAKVGAGTGGAIAGGLLGIVAAPMMGIAAGVMANKKLAGEMEDTSPQTSDDESVPGAWAQIMKTNNKVVRDMLGEDVK